MERTPNRLSMWGNRRRVPSGLSQASFFDIDRRTSLGRGLKAAQIAAGFSVKEAASKLSSFGLECKRGTLLAWERGGGRSSRTLRQRSGCDCGPLWMPH